MRILRGRHGVRRGRKGPQWLGFGSRRHCTDALEVPMTLLFFLLSGCQPEPFDLGCGDLVCEGSTEACLDDCGASTESPYRCVPIPRDKEDCSGSAETGYRCSTVCG